MITSFSLLQISISLQMQRFDVVACCRTNTTVMSLLNKKLNQNQSTNNSCLILASKERGWIKLRPVSRKIFMTQILWHEQVDSVTLRIKGSGRLRHRHERTSEVDQGCQWAQWVLLSELQWTDCRSLFSPKGNRSFNYRHTKAGHLSLWQGSSVWLCVHVRVWQQAQRAEAWPDWED